MNKKLKKEHHQVEVIKYPNLYYGFWKFGNKFFNIDKINENRRLNKI